MSHCHFDFLDGWFGILFHDDNGASPQSPPKEGEPCIDLLNCISGKHEAVKRQMVYYDVDLLDEKNTFFARGPKSFPLGRI